MKSMNKPSRKNEFIWNFIKNKTDEIVAYSIAKQICESQKIDFHSKHANTWKVTVSKAFKKFEEDGKIQFIKEEKGVAPFPKRIFKILMEK